MSDLEKYQLYILYISRRYGLINWFDLKIVGEKYYNELGWNKPDKVIGNCHLRYLWKDLYEPVSFKDFCQDTTTIDGIKHWYMVKYNKAYV